MINLWALKIFTSDGFVKNNILEGKKALDIGCGQKKMPGATGMDILENSQADIVHDISKFPWPLAEDIFDVVLANNIIEHLDDVLGALSEIHRVCKPGARVVIQVPYFRSVQAFTDLTHKHFFTSSSMDYVIEGTQLSRYSYVSFRFKKVGFWYGWPHPSNNLLVRFFKKIICKYSKFYDKYLSLLFPVACLTWELEIIKE